MILVWIFIGHGRGSVVFSVRFFFCYVVEDFAVVSKWMTSR